MRIDWSDRAIADLSEIRDYIAEDSESRAVTFLQRLFSAIEHLEHFPDSGRRVPEAPELPELRELLVEKYRVVYRRLAHRVEMVLIVHGQRDLAGTDPKPWS